MEKNQDLQEIATLMRSEWDDRIHTDYRYWMSDGVEDDDAMWRSGHRDFTILTNGLLQETLKESSVLDVGCGVGRIVYPASEIVKEIVGVDVSLQAIEQALKFKNLSNNVSFLIGNGLNLEIVKDKKFDLIISFAALCSIPSRIMANYISEFARLLKVGGKLRIQLYLGKEQELNEEDTLALRSYDQSRFENALNLSGLELDYIEELNLDFEVSDYEKGIVAYIIGAVRTESKSADFDDIYNALVGKPEKIVGSDWQGSETASYVALARVRQLIEKEDFEAAGSALTLAKKSYNGTKEDIRNIISELENKLKSNPVENNNNDNQTISLSSKLSKIETTEGPTLQYKGISLSHASKPLEAARNWAERTLNSMESRKNSILMVGVGDSNFLIQLSELTNQKIIVFESDSDLIDYSKYRVDKNFIFLKTIQDVEKLLDESSEKINLVILPSAPFYMKQEVENIRNKFRKKYLIKNISPNIGIVGPLYGGTLPIAGYIKDALKNLGQKVEYIDLSGYLGSYNSFDKFLKNKSNKDILECGFVNLMSDLIYQIVEEKKLDIVISVALAPISPTVLEKLNKKGVITAHWFMEDTRRFTTWKEIAKYYDYFFVFQKGESIEEVKNAGAKRVHYLPLAYSQNDHKKIDISIDEKNIFGSKISFVGAGYNNRRHIFSKLSDLDIKIWGSEWPDVIPFKRMVQRSGARISVEEYVKIFNASEVNINLHSSHERDGIDPSGDSVNPRTFELAGCKAFQLVDERTLLPELFEIGKEIITFDSLNDLREKINYYLKRPDLREEISNNAYVRAKQYHTYEKRLEEMMELILLDFGDSLRKKINQGPWPKTLEAAKDKPDLYSRFKKIEEQGEEPTLEALVNDITEGKGKLSEVEMKLMFLHHMRGQIVQVNKLRNGNGV